MKDKMVFNLAVIPLCFYLLRTISSASVVTLSYLTIAFAVFSIMAAYIFEFGFKYGKAARNIKLRKSLEAMLLKFNLSVLFLFIGVCMMFVYGRDSEWERLAILLASVIAAGLIITRLDMNKGSLNRCKNEN